MSQNLEDLIVTLQGEDGEEEAFLLMDSLEHNGKTYVFLIPSEQAEEEEQEVVIMEYQENDNEESIFAGIEDEALVDELFELFLQSAEEEGEEEE